jgi:hypothetical protein
MSTPLEDELGGERQRWRVRSWAKRRDAIEPCDAAPDPARRTSAGCPRERRPELARARDQLLDGVLGRNRIHRQTGPELQSGDLAEPRVDLPVPVVRRVDLLAKRRGVQDEVVRRAVERRRERGEHLPERIRRRREIGVADASEIGLVTTGHDPDLER